MRTDATTNTGNTAEGEDLKIHHLARSALQLLASEQLGTRPRTRHDWVERLVDALIVEAEGPHQLVITDMTSSGATSDEIYESIIPEASRLLGELWVRDQITFVDVTVGAGRLQKLYRDRTAHHESGWLRRTTPLGQPILMVIPDYEDHSLGAFVAADSFRRHGLWVHMAIGLNSQEVVATITAHRFAMIGITISSKKHIEKAASLIDTLRQSGANPPPFVVGGRIVETESRVAELTGADFASRSAREAIEQCGLSTVVASLGLDRVG